MKYDTDGDIVSDGDEVELGLNPLNPATNGYPDNEYTTKQSLGDGSTALDYINTVENNPYTVSVDLTAAGIVENNLSVTESGYSNAIKNSAIIGVAPEFYYTDGLSVKEATIKFKLDNSVINNTLGTYAEHNDEFKGIKRLNIFTFVEGINMLLPVETFYDETTNTIYTKTDQMGTYCLIDIEIFLQNLGIEPSEDNSSDVGGNTFESVLDNEANLRYNDITANVRTNDTGYRNDFDLIFIIDEVNYTNEELNSIEKKISDLSEEIWERSPATTISIIEIYGSGAVKDISFQKKNKGELNAFLKSIVKRQQEGYLDVSMAVDYIADEYEDKNVYCVAFFDSNANFYSETYIDGKVKSAKSTLLDIKHNAKDNINISVVSNLPEDKNESTYFSMMTGNTGGLTFSKDVSDEDFSSNMLKHIYNEDEIYIITSAGLTLLPSDFGVISTISEQDYDKDGLPDVEEIYFDVTDKKGHKLVTINDDGTVKLPNFYACAQAEDEYIQASMDKFREKCKFYSNNLEKTHVLTIKSALLDADGDNDGIIDKYDKNPLKYCENNDDIKDNYDNAFVTFKLDKPDEKVTIMSPIIPLKAFPDWNSATLKTINGVNGKEGKEFKVEYVTITSNDSWVKIYNDGAYGYVHSSYVKANDSNETLLKIMFSKKSCLDGLKYTVDWTDGGGEVNISTTDKGLITQYELGFLYQMCKSTGIDFLQMIMISMHETQLGKYPTTWKGVGSDASKDKGTGYMACNVWAQRNVASGIFHDDLMVKSWSDYAMRLDKESEYTHYSSKATGEYYATCCSRDYHFGNLVCGVVTLRNDLVAASGKVEKDEQLYYALLYYGNDYDKVAGIYKKHLNGEKTMSDEFLYCYKIAKAFFAGWVF